MSADFPVTSQFAPKVVVTPFCVSDPEMKLPEVSNTNTHSRDQPDPSVSKPVSVFVPFPLSFSKRRDVHVPSEKTSPIHVHSSSKNVVPLEVTSPKVFEKEIARPIIAPDELS